MVVVAATSGGALADEVSPAAGVQLDEVVVTAQKRSESLQTVPLSVAVLSEQELARTGVFSTSEYASLVPNVSFNAKAGGDGRATAENLVIRGVTGGNTTARYIDDAAVPPGIDLKIVDVARIEVLRGPQGTLYGASSMGGATKIVTNQPSLSSVSADTAARVSTVDHGDANYRVDGVVNLPVLQDSFGVRLVGYYDNESGVFNRLVGNSPVTVEHRIDGERDSGAQLKGLWVLGGGWSVAPFVMYQKEVADGAHLADITPGNFTQIRVAGLAEPLHDTLVHSGVKVDYAGESFQLTSATSYSSWKTREREDATEFIAFAFGLDTPIPSPMDKEQHTHVFQQEIRASSTGSGPFGWQAGAYFTHSNNETQYLEYAAGIGDLLGLGTDLIYHADDHISQHEIAGFGELSYALTERLKATGGLRWFHSVLDADIQQDGIVNGGVSQSSGTQSQSGVDPKAILEFQATPDTMLYTSAAKGYRPGNINQPVPESQCGLTGPASFNSDSLWTYEGGAKTSWLDHRLRVNGALFWIDWSNIQQRVLLPCGFSYTANVGAARNRGAELEITARPLQALELSGGLGYTDAVITRGAPNVEAQPGDRVQQVPKVTANFSAEYRWFLPGGMDAFLRAGYQYQSRSFTTFSQTNPARIRDPFNLLNLRAGVASGAWRVALFADNVTNEHVNYSDTTSLAAEVPGRPRYATNRPRTIGIEMGYHFGN